MAHLPSPAAFAAVREQLAALGVPGAADAPVSFGVLVLAVERGAVLATAGALRQAGFEVFLDVTAVDWLGRGGAPRFEVVWHFYSTTHRLRVRVTTRVPESDATVDSLVPLYGSARYMERECHEMLGIGFAGNDDLRPILLYEGFVGHPLRKDYPKGREQPLVPWHAGYPADATVPPIAVQPPPGAQEA